MLLSALRRVARRPGLVLLLWLAGLLPALGGTLPTLAALHSILDRRPAAAALSAGRADVLWGEILLDNRAMAVGGVAAAVLALALGWLVLMPLGGGLLCALRRPGHPRHAAGTAVLLRAVEFAGPLLLLGLAGLLLRLPLLALAGGAGYLLSQLYAEWSLLRVALLGGGLLLVLLCAWSALSVVLHYAQLHRMEPGVPLREATARALGRGLRQAGGALRPTLLLALLSVGGLGLAVLLPLVAMRFLDARLPFPLVFAAQQILSLPRAVVSLWVLAGVVEVAEAGTPSMRTPM